MTAALDKSLDGLNDCGCCEGQTARTPASVENPPALEALAYRVGTHGTFKQSMLARLSSSEHPALAGLTTRDDDDFSIGLLDSWATVADVLTFYQERIANESYLRTATERLSVRGLARLIGYRLKPGVAASAYLGSIPRSRTSTGLTRSPAPPAGPLPKCDGDGIYRGIAGPSTGTIR